MTKEEKILHIYKATLLKRITINYLRHNMTNYHHKLTKLFGQVGKNIAYQILKDKVNNVILEKYDYLRPNIELNYKTKI